MFIPFYEIYRVRIFISSNIYLLYNISGFYRKIQESKYHVELITLFSNAAFDLIINLRIVKHFKILRNFSVLLLCNFVLVPMSFSLQINECKCRALLVSPDMFRNYRQNTFAYAFETHGSENNVESRTV